MKYTMQPGEKIAIFMVEPIFENDLVIRDGQRETWLPEGKRVAGWRDTRDGAVELKLSAFPVGAMWRAYWYSRNTTWSNETEPHLIVRVPNGEYTHDFDIDSRAGNCSATSDSLHRCWIRHGNGPNITVDKAGTTCSAGGGSIGLGNWHGRIRDGHLSLW